METVVGEHFFPIAGLYCDKANHAWLGKHG